MRKKITGQSAFYQSVKELCLYKCMLFFDDIFNKQQCGFHKDYGMSAKCLLKLLEKWK